MIPLALCAEYRCHFRSWPQEFQRTVQKQSQNPDGEERFRLQGRDHNLAFRGERLGASESGLICQKAAIGRHEFEMAECF